MNTIDPGPDSMQQSENAYLTTSKFDSYDELVKSVREFYYTKGYGISIHLYYHVSQFALKEIHKQYKIAKDGIVFPCTGHYMATMGLPCAHQIKHWHGATYSLDCIHPQWRIDTLLLNSTNFLHDKDALSLITKLVNQYDTVFEPVIQRPKGRPPKSKKKRGVTSTTRFPSRFELVESSQRRTFIDLNAYPFDTCDLDGPF
ncbi:hypothetical protein LXL04_021443 [Taraxacum kok-saghyz]